MPLIFPCGRARVRTDRAVRSTNPLEEARRAHAAADAHGDDAVAAALLRSSSASAW